MEFDSQSAHTNAPHPHHYAEPVYPPQPPAQAVSPQFGQPEPQSFQPGAASFVAPATVTPTPPQPVVPATPVYQPPTPPVVATPAPNADATSMPNPMPVVKVLSPIGLEYAFMTISLFAAAGALTAALLSLVNGEFSFAVLSFPTALLVVSVPVFAYLFLRTKRLELTQPHLRLDPSKRRSTQFTQIVCFLVSFFTLVAFVFSVFGKLGGQFHTSIGKTALDCLVLLVVFGGILAYYWRDEHQR